MSQVAQMVNIHVFYAFMFFTSMLRGSKIRESEKNITNCNKNKKISVKFINFTRTNLISLYIASGLCNLYSGRIIDL